MNQSLKWKNDYIFLLRDTTKKLKEKMDSVLDRMCEEIGFSVSKEFPQYIVLVRKPRGKILGKKQKKLFETVESTTKNIYHNYARDCSNLRYSFFPYFKLVRNFGDYHFHFLVISKEYTV